MRERMRQRERENERDGERESKWKREELNAWQLMDSNFDEYLISTSALIAQWQSTGLVNQGSWVQTSLGALFYTCATIFSTVSHESFSKWGSIIFCLIEMKKWICQIKCEALKGPEVEKKHFDKQPGLEPLLPLFRDVMPKAIVVVIVVVVLHRQATQLLDDRLLQLRRHPDSRVIRNCQKSLTRTIIPTALVRKNEINIWQL